MFDNRFYRKYHGKKGLVPFNVTVKETNLNIQAEKDLSDFATRAVLKCRNILENYIELHPEFATSFSPVSSSFGTPAIIEEMIHAARLAEVGPMASVAGMVAQETGRQLLHHSSQIVVENGGDIFVKSLDPMLFGIYAKNSPFFMKAGIRVAAQAEPYGICTSSGMLGHSKSFGKADAVTVLSDSCLLADAVATSLGNRVKTHADIQQGIEFAKSIPGIRGVVIIKAKHIGLWGDLQLEKI